ncbi:hypothetical protein [Blastomonas sp.]|uniref:hypothetical protein n=1 Tax=Blastomonas sp. TaxID=1909299 RepID=UPI00180E883F|nr:hypothetical protein [Blastomonas sp.]
MADKDPQDTEILTMIAGANDAIDPQALVDQLCNQYELSSVIEALQRAIERGKISLNSDGMVIAVAAEYAHAA